MKSSDPRKCKAAAWFAGLFGLANGLQAGAAPLPTPPTDPVGRCVALAAYPFPGQPGVAWDALEPETAIPVCEAAIQAHPEQPDLHAHLCRALHKGKRFEEAATHCRLAAEQGNPVAQNNLGVMYAAGEGVEKSDREAFVWYRKAAEQGIALTQNNLGDMYAEGRGVEQSDVEAVAWYRKAAAQGNARAQTNLGWMYEQGHGLEQSYQEAAAWYRKAADQGYARAQTNLGFLYEKGQGVEQSDAAALDWYRRGADQGFARAQHNLATR
jgi:TPR repeat protein